MIRDDLEKFIKEIESILDTYQYPEKFYYPYDSKFYHRAEVREETYISVLRQLKKILESNND